MMAVCVDRHSGWIVAIPVLEKGLTGARLAKLMVKDHWRPFGVPSIISSDQGSHFVSTWWQNLCSLLGIRQAFAQAYHHQANARVERAGHQIMEVLCNLYAQEKINWPGKRRCASQEGRGLLSLSLVTINVQGYRNVVLFPIYGHILDRWLKWCGLRERISEDSSFPGGRE